MTNFWTGPLRDDLQRMTQVMEYFLDRVENDVGKGKNAGYQHLLLYPECFQKISFPGSSNLLIKWCFMLFLSVFYSYHADSSNWSCFPQLPGWSFEVFCPRTLP